MSKGTDFVTVVNGEYFVNKSVLFTLVGYASFKNSSKADDV